MRGNVGPMPDAVRGIAALMVAVGHAWQVFLYPFDKSSEIFYWLGAGAAWAVAIFFLLSGILIAFSVRQRSRHGHFDVLKYFEARALRIYPPLVAAVAITVGSVMLIQGFGLYGSHSYMLPGDQAVARPRATFEWSEVLGTLALTYNIVPGHKFLNFDGPLWSLSYEVWLYVLAGFACAALINRSRVALFFTVIVSVQMFMIAKSAPPVWSVATVWAAGFAVGWYWQRAEDAPAAWWAAASALCLALALLIANGELKTYLVPTYSGVRQSAFYVTFSMALLGGLMMVLKSGMTPCRALVELGNCSYTLYLTHFPLLLLCCSLFRPYVLPFGWAGHAALAAISLSAIIAAAWLLSRLVENRPLLRTMIGR